MYYGGPGDYNAIQVLCCTNTLKTAYYMQHLATYMYCFCHTNTHTHTHTHTQMEHVTDVSLMWGCVRLTIVFGTIPRPSFSSTTLAPASERYPWLGTRQLRPKQHGQQSLWIHLVHFGLR